MSESSSELSSESSSETAESSESTNEYLFPIVRKRWFIVFSVVMHMVLIATEVTIGYLIEEDIFICVLAIANGVFFGSLMIDPFIKCLCCDKCYESKPSVSTFPNYVCSRMWGEPPEIMDIWDGCGSVRYSDWTDQIMIDEAREDDFWLHVPTANWGNYLRTKLFVSCNVFHIALLVFYFVGSNEEENALWYGVMIGVGSVNCIVLLGGCLLHYCWSILSFLEVIY
jgi:hypothetical protein